ncbi:MAG: hypothetical protein NE334_21780 [Lentisphaeraceae bacterium]|nr:hypothetical protein [Lentisphaeraceae bacterium]
MIKDDEQFRKRPVVALTNSEAEKDVVQTYELHANSYIVKPVNLIKFVEIVGALENFWFNIVMLPSAEKESK